MTEQFWKDHAKRAEEHAAALAEQCEALQVENDRLEAEMRSEKEAFFMGYSAGHSASSAGLEGLPTQKERDYEVWRARCKKSA